MPPSSDEDNDAKARSDGKPGKGAGKRSRLSIDDIGHVPEDGKQPSLMDADRARAAQKRQRLRLTEMARPLPNPALERAAETAKATTDTARATTETADAMRALADSARVSTILAGIAAGAAMFALLVSLAAYRVAFNASDGDRKWQREQTQLLMQIRDRLPAQPGG